MKASTAIYRYVIKPSFGGAVACALAWLAMRVLGVTQVFGWDVSYGGVFVGGFIVTSLAADLLGKRPQPVDEGAPKPQAPPSEHSPRRAVTPEQNVRAKAPARTAPTVPTRTLDQAAADQSYLPREGHFRVVQAGRTVAAVDGVVELAKAPFEVVYDGPCTEQAVILMQTPALNAALDATGLFTIWGRSGDGVSRSPGDLFVTQPERIQLADLPAARASLVAVASRDAPALLEKLVSQDPHLSIVIAAPRMPLTERAIEFRSIAEVPIESCPDQVLHLTHLSTVRGYGGEGGWHWIKRLEWGGFAIHISNRRAHQESDHTIKGVASGALQRAETHYKSGEFPEAFEAFMEAAVAGSPRAWYFAGEMLQNGMGVAQDHSQGRKMLEAAAEAEDPDAMYSVACGYSNGHAGFPKDAAKALNFMRKAARAGHAEALAGLGNIYEEGRGVPRDLSRAHTLYREAKARGSTLVDLYLDNNS